MNQFIEFFVNHWLLWSAFIIVAVAILVFELRQRVGGIPRVSPQAAVQSMNHDNALVLDVRSKDEFVQGHIVNAKHIPHTEILSRINSLVKYKQTPIIVVCQMGPRAVQAAQELSKHGFEKLAILAGGMNAWRADSLPVEKN
ncbi:MAG: hypothetical protein CMF50_02275 [Legionellales bacterium]|nr:hypothetical protein [Legionellales bacterium]|tara:strand:- start:20027 stop:20452 length:426 start_codon:yes stop_codon:yes gene_type:complete